MTVDHLDAMLQRLAVLPSELPATVSLSDTRFNGCPVVITFDQSGWGGRKGVIKRPTEYGWEVHVPEPPPSWVKTWNNVYNFPSDCLRLDT